MILSIITCFIACIPKSVKTVRVFWSVEEINYVRLSETTRGILFELKCWQRLTDDHQLLENYHFNCEPQRRIYSVPPSV